MPERVFNPITEDVRVVIRRERAAGLGIREIARRHSLNTRHVSTETRDINVTESQLKKRISYVMKNYPFKSDEEIAASEHCDVEFVRIRRKAREHRIMAIQRRNSESAKEQRRIPEKWIPVEWLRRYCSKQERDVYQIAAVFAVHGVSVDDVKRSCDRAGLKVSKIGLVGDRSEKKIVLRDSEHVRVFKVGLMRSRGR